MGIDFIDTIVVRHSTERGTKTTDKPVKPVTFMGKEHKKQDDERLKLAGDLKIKLSEMTKVKIPDPKGFYISTGKGTGRVKL